MKPEITQALLELDAARTRLCELRSSCEHKIVPDDPTDPESSTGICSECGMSTGTWFCPANGKSHQCEYTNESGEWCIHCGNPEERL